MNEERDKEIRVLLVEDVSIDAELIQEALKDGGLKFTAQRVDTKDAFLRELMDNPPDVILSDHGLPTFSGLAALAIVQERCPAIPFIFVTDAIVPEMEIEKLAPGATGLIAKSNLPKLAPAIRQALVEPKPRRKLTPEEREKVVGKLLELLASYEMQGTYIPICSSCKKIRDKDGRWYLPELYFMKHLELKFTHSMCPDCLPIFMRDDLSK